MKKYIFFLLLIILVACNPTTTPDPNLEYYRGIYDTCVYAAQVANDPNAGQICVPVLQQAVDEDWRSQTSWPKMVDIDFSDGKGLQKYDKNDPKFEYYRAVYNICIYTNVKDQGESKVADYCLTESLQTALDEHWYDKKDWSTMPNIEFNPNKPSGE